jgi:hypothetical protein
MHVPGRKESLGRPAPKAGAERLMNQRTFYLSPF